MAVAARLSLSSRAARSCTPPAVTQPHRTLKEHGICHTHQPHHDASACSKLKTESNSTMLQSTLWSQAGAAHRAGLGFQSLRLRTQAAQRAPGWTGARPLHWRARRSAPAWSLPERERARRRPRHIRARSLQGPAWGLHNLEAHEGRLWGQGVLPRPRGLESA